MPSNREKHCEALRPLVLAALDSPGLLSPSDFDIARFHLSANLRKHLLDPDIAALEDYVIDHSTLPGRQANLAMVGAFADEVGALCDAPDVSLNRSYVAMEWLLWRLMNRYPPALFGSDPDSPLQMPEVCGVVAFGEWAAAFRHIESGVEILLEHAHSPLWRVRDAAAMGFARMLARDWRSTLRRFRRRALNATPLEWRALVMGISVPERLTAPGHALDALDLHFRALSYLRRLSPAIRRQEPVAVLCDALSTTISDVVAAAPAAGFAQLHAWAAWDNPLVQDILRANLAQARLAAWPDEVAAVRARLPES
jgi:hypothetical protein